MASVSRDSIANTLLVAIGLSFVCSILVATTAVVLKPVQQRNEDEFRQRIILEVAGLMRPMKASRRCSRPLRRTWLKSIAVTTSLI